MANESHIDTVYAIAWPDRNILKVGYSHNRRWRTFTARGGVLVALEEFATSTEAFAREGLLHARLAHIAPRAFSTRDQARPFLGGSGGGWIECYQISAEKYKEVADIG